MTPRTPSSRSPAHFSSHAGLIFHPQHRHVHCSSHTHRPRATPLVLALPHALHPLVHHSLRFSVARVRCRRFSSHLDRSRFPALLYAPFSALFDSHAYFTPVDDQPGTARRVSRSARASSPSNKHRLAHYPVHTRFPRSTALVLAQSTALHRPVHFPSQDSPGCGQQRPNSSPTCCCARPRSTAHLLHAAHHSLHCTALV